MTLPLVFLNWKWWLFATQRTILIVTCEHSLFHREIPCITKNKEIGNTYHTHAFRMDLPNIELDCKYSHRLRLGSTTIYKEESRGKDESVMTESTTMHDWHTKPEERIGRKMRCNWRVFMALFGQLQSCVEKVKNCNSHTISASTVVDWWVWC